MTLSKSEARRLAKNAAELDANVLRGLLEIGPDGATVNGTNILEWLAQYADGELILVAAPVGNDRFIESDIKSCHTCGRDYQGERCPYCAEARARLRNR
jgi:hypothetical protein